MDYKASSPCYCLNLRRASRAVSQIYDEALKPSGLTIAQFSLLSHLATIELVTISELSKLMRVDRTTLNRNMKPLLAAGLIAVKRGTDSRTRQIRVTESGQAAYDHGWQLWLQAQTALKDYIGPDDLTKLKQLLAKLEAIVV